MFGFEQFLQSQDAIFVSRSYLVNVGVASVVLFAASVWLFRNMDKFAVGNVQIASLLLVLFAYLSQYWTLAPSEFHQYYDKAIPYFVLYLVVAPIISIDEKSLKTGVWTALYLGIPLVFLFVFYVEWDGRGVRLARPTMKFGQLVWYSPCLALSSMAAYVGMLAIILIPKNRLLIILHFTVFCLACYVAYRTQSRGQILALGAVALVCYPLANQATKLKGMFLTLAGFMVLTAGLFFVFSYFDLGNINRFRGEYVRAALEGRAIAIEDLLNAWINSEPLTILVGLGSASSFVTSGAYVHNLPAEILGELGIVGAGFFLFIYIQVAINSVKILRKLEHFPEVRREFVAILALFLFSAIICLKEGSLFKWPNLFFFAILISQMERHSRKFAGKSTSLNQLFIAMPSPTPVAAIPTFNR